jgi:hypothetical protein
VTNPFNISLAGIRESYQFEPEALMNLFDPSPDLQSFVSPAQAAAFTHDLTPQDTLVSSGHALASCEEHWAVGHGTPFQHGQHFGGSDYDFESAKPEIHNNDAKYVEPLSSNELECSALSALSPSIFAGHITPSHFDPFSTGHILSDGVFDPLELAVPIYPTKNYHYPLVDARMNSQLELGTLPDFFDLHFDLQSLTLPT